MAKAETTSTRAPRGSKPVSQAFFAALETIPEASRAAVAKAAQIMIRDELKVRRDKLKAATARQKARKPATAKRGADPATAAKTKPESAKSAAKPGRRKPANARAAA